MKNRIIISFLVVVIFVCTGLFGEEKKSDSPDNFKPYFGQTPPGDEPKLFIPGFIYKNHRYLGRIAFSPDLKECFYTVTDTLYTTSGMYVTRFENGKWTVPVPAPFSVQFEKIHEPFYTPDGNRLYFTATVKDSKSKMDFWMVERTAQGWGKPECLPAPINSDLNDFCFSQVLDGTMYFLSERGGTPQVYRARQKPDKTYQVEMVPEPILSLGTYEGDPCVAPDGRFMVFYSGRPGGFGYVDLYVSFPDGKGEWTQPVNLGPKFNTAADEYNATLSPDGKYLFFIRHNLSSGDIYWVSTNAIEKLRPQKN